MNHAPSVVKGTVRPQYSQGLPRQQKPPAPQQPPNRLPYVYRADPVALDALHLDLTARAVFVLLLDNAKSKGWKSRLSNATIGRILGRCPMTISRALGRLESRGLIRRDLIAGGRIRLSITITWDGVRREDLTEQASVRRESRTGSARASEGLGAAVEQIESSSPQSEANRPAGASLAEEEDAELARLHAELGPAAFLRMMIAKGREQAPAPESTQKVCRPTPTPQPAQDATQRTIEGFARSLGEPLALDELRPARRRR